MLGRVASASVTTPRAMGFQVEVWAHARPTDTGPPIGVVVSTPRSELGNRPLNW